MCLYNEPHEKLGQRGTLAARVILAEQFILVEEGTAAKKGMAAEEALQPRKAWRLSWPRGSFLLLVCGWVLFSCARHHPPALPVVGIYSRSTARIDVSEVVVKKAKKRDEVRAIYEEIAQRAESLAALRGASNETLASLSKADVLDEARVHAQIEVIKRDQREAFQHYVGLQMRLRELLTESEFEKLGRFD